MKKVVWLVRKKKLLKNFLNSKHFSKFSWHFSLISLHLPQIPLRLSCITFIFLLISFHFNTKIFLFDYSVVFYHYCQSIHILNQVIFYTFSINVSYVWLWMVLVLIIKISSLSAKSTLIWRQWTDTSWELKKKKGIVRWDLEGPRSSDYLAHCSHLLFMSIRMEFSASYSMCYLRALQHRLRWPGLYKPWVLSVSFEALMPIAAILILATDCMLLLHQLVIGSVTKYLIVMVLKCMDYITCIILNVLQTGCTVASQLGFELGSLVWRDGSLLSKPNEPASWELKRKTKSKTQW